jgi:PGF-pre-PGF domain-containing protein
MGGYDGTTYFNDVWRSTDGGAHWTNTTPQDPGDLWTARYAHTSVAMPDGSIVLMGGMDSRGRLNDTWRSTDGGTTWTRQTEHAGWTARSGHTSVALPDGSIVLIGGMDSRGLLNDTWQLQPAGSSLQNPTHTYTAPGTYSVALQAYNDDGYGGTRRNDYITVSAAPAPTPTSGPVHSGGGGGGSTGGPDGYNVGGDSAVSKVNVTGTGLEMLIVTGWKQSSPGAGIPPVPGIAYQYVDLVPARFEEITGANITFTVPVAWLEEHGFTPEEIVLYHYNGTAWEALPTWIVDAAGTTVTFRAATPGFSLFAICGIEQAGEAVTTPTTARTTVQAVAEPTAMQTTAAPAGGSAPEFPLGMIALAGGAILVLIGTGFLARRWWIRRQNPALFRDYD